jgi:hypothetical protein
VLAARTWKNLETSMNTVGYPDTMPPLQHGWAAHPHAGELLLDLHPLQLGIRLKLLKPYGGQTTMPLGTLDVMKLDGQSESYQVMFEQNAGGQFVARVQPDALLDFLTEEMRVDAPVAEDAARHAKTDGRARVGNIFLEENNLHAIMEYLEEDD